MLYKLLSLLLSYPDREFCRHFREIEDAVAGLEMSPPDRDALNGFLAWSQSLPVTEFQARYVETFDLTPDNALYLTHHLFEEQDRERGVTLATLSEYFKAEGFTVDAGELPDYLPLILEYVSTLEDETLARSFLSQSAQALEVVANNLRDTGSPWSPLLDVVLRHGEQAGVRRPAAAPN